MTGAVGPSSTRGSLPERATSGTGGRVVRVLPNSGSLNRAFDYLVPPGWEDKVSVGSRVRVALGPRRVGGWVIEDDVEPPAGVELRPLAKWSGWGPSAELVELARWAAWRWAGRQSHFLVTGSPEGVVTALPAPGAGKLVATEVLRDVQPSAPPGRHGRSGEGAIASLTSDALVLERAVLRLAPSVDRLHPVEAIVQRLLRPGRSVLVLAPSLAGAGHISSALSARGWPVALLPGGWAAAAAGGRVVVGARAAAWAPAPNLAGVVVLGAHDQGYESEAAPTWCAWRVVAERARVAGVPCVLVSPCPSLEMLAWGALLSDSRSAERRGWAALEIVDMRSEDPHRGIYSERLVALLRTASAEPGGQVVCVLNRTGRARLLACYGCDALARCEHCGGAMAQPSRVGTASGDAGPHRPSEALGPAAGGPDRDSAEGLVCRICGKGRPVVCTACGSGRMKTLRVGVARVREELGALSGVDVEEMSGPPAGAVNHGALTAPVVVGTEAVLHRMLRARAVAFLDMDQELLAPRFRAGEDALVLLARASRLVGGREAGGRVVAQTRVPDHEVLAGALHADPDRPARSELERRTLLRLPPRAALALVSGAGAEGYVSGLRELRASGLEVRGPDRATWLVRAPDHDVLCGALAAVSRPKARLRIQVDPRHV